MSPNLRSSLGNMLRSANKSISDRRGSDPRLHTAIDQITNVIQATINQVVPTDNIIDTILISGLNTVNAPTINAIGDRLTMYLTYPETGLATVKTAVLPKPPYFKNISFDDIDSRPGKISIYLFHARTVDEWWCIGTRFGRN